MKAYLRLLFVLVSLLFVSVSYSQEANPTDNLTAPVNYFTITNYTDTDAELNFSETVELHAPYYWRTLVDVFIPSGETVIIPIELIPSSEDLGLRRLMIRSSGGEGFGIATNHFKINPEEPY